MHAENTYQIFASCILTCPGRGALDGLAAIAATGIQAGTQESAERSLAKAVAVSSRPSQ
jgi:hypothetical protein